MLITHLYKFGLTISNLPLNYDYLISCAKRKKKKQVDEYCGKMVYKSVNRQMYHFIYLFMGFIFSLQASWVIAVEGCPVMHMYCLPALVYDFICFYFWFWVFQCHCFLSSLSGNYFSMFMYTLLYTYIQAFAWKCSFHLHAEL